jgi:DNA gyrase subunit B
VEKAKINKMLENGEIKSIVAALGSPVLVLDFNAEKVRYGKIIIMTDADVDGSHIRTLLSNIFLSSYERPGCFRQGLYCSATAL